MKLRKLLEINAIYEDETLAQGLLSSETDSYDYDSSSLGLIDINDMDIKHFIRAFKVLNKKCNNLSRTSVHNNQSKVALNLIAGKLHIAVDELEEYMNND